MADELTGLNRFKVLVPLGQTGLLTSVRHNEIIKWKEDIRRMPVSSARNRLIYFRVSEEELSRFRSLATLKGSRSLSDFAREALEKLSGASSGGAAMDTALLDQIQELRKKVDSMSSRLEQLNEQLIVKANQENTKDEEIPA